jgi:hypothetical protein
VPNSITNCIACHQSDLKGLRPIYPSLLGNTPILESAPVVSLVALYGMNSDDSAKCSPGFYLSDEQIAALTEYIQRINGREVEVPPEMVAKLRESWSDRELPTREEVLQIAGQFSLPAEEVTPIPVDEEALKALIAEEKANAPELPIGNGFFLEDGDFQVVIFPRAFGDNARIYRIAPNSEDLKPLLDELGESDSTGNRFFYEIPKSLKRKYLKEPGK